MAAPQLFTLIFDDPPRGSIFQHIGRHDHCQWANAPAINPQRRGDVAQNGARRDDKAIAKTWRDTFRKAAHMDSEFGLQGRKRRDVGSEQRAIDVVFDDQYVVTPCYRNKRATALFAQGDRCRIVEAWHEENRARAGARARRLECVRPHPLSIIRQSTQIKTLRSAQSAEALVGNQVGQYEVATLRQRAQHAGQAVLGAIGQDDTAGVAITRDAVEPVGNRGARPDRAFGRMIVPHRPETPVFGKTRQERSERFQIGRGRRAIDGQIDQPSLVARGGFE